MLQSAKRSDKKRGRVCKLTLHWLTTRLSTGICAATGLPFEFPKPGQGERIGRVPCRPSLDRIDSARGYTRNNCRIVLYWYNIAKAEWGEDLVISLMKAAVRHHERHA